MKQKTIKILTILVTLLLFTNCNKDIEDEVTKANQLEYNGITYELTTGAIVIGDLQDGERSSVIVLYSKNLSLNSEGRFDGKGEIFWFEDIIHTSESIQGTYLAYDWLNTNQESEPGLIEEVEFGVNWSEDTPELEREWYEFYEGEANIKIDGETYTITFNGTDEQGIKVSLYYKGSLTEV